MNAEVIKPLENKFVDKYNNNSAVCKDRLLRYFQGSNESYFGVEYFGCCSTRMIKTVEDSVNHCCLTFGSKCDDSASLLRCCGEERCNNGYCPLTAGTPLTPILGLKKDSKYRTSTRPKNSRFFFNYTSSTLKCADPTYPMEAKMYFYDQVIYACCKSDYSKNITDAADKCCLLANEPCDSTIPCCRDGQNMTCTINGSNKTCRDRSACIEGRCSGSSGDSNDKSLTQSCLTLQAPEANKDVLTVNDTLSCSKYTAFRFYAEDSSKKVMGCCRGKPKDAMESTNHCCLVAGSTCQATIECCKHLYCCGGYCSGLSGSKYASKKEIPYNY